MTAPLVPADCNLQDFAFMPLDCVRLRDSDLAAKATADEFRAAVILWCASWHQLPAASLPNDDEVLAKLSGYGRVIKEWLKVKVGALRGWILCDDGRLYHPVVAEKAMEAWRGKLGQRWKTECARMRKHNQRHSTELSVPEFDHWLSLGCPQGHVLPVPEDKSGVSQGQPRETHSKGQGEGQGEGQGQGQINTTTSPKKPGAAIPLDPVKDEIWRSGRGLLEGQGDSREAAGSFLGKLCKDFGQVLVLDAVRDCVSATPAEAKAWLTARCQERRAQSGNKSTAIEQRNRAAVNEALQEANRA